MTHPGPVVIPGSGVPEFAQEFDVEVARHQARLEADRVASHDGPLPHLGPSVCGVCSPYGGSDPVTPAEERTGVDLSAIKARWATYQQMLDRTGTPARFSGRMCAADVPALIGEIEVLRASTKERTGVSDRAAAALTDVAELRRETFRLWSAGTVGRHDGLARLDRIEAALRGEQR